MTAPRYLTKEAFDKYAPDLGYALNLYPVAARIDISGSVETYAARFRDARKAKQLHGWKHPAVNEDLFKSHADSLVVAMRNGYVLIGTPKAIRTYEEVGQVGYKKGTPVPDNVEVDLTDEECATMLCELISRKAFKTPIAFTVGPLTEVKVRYLETNYNVTLVPVSGREQIYTLL